MDDNVQTDGIAIDFLWSDVPSFGASGDRKVEVFYDVNGVRVCSSVTFTVYDPIVYLDNLTPSFEYVQLMDDAFQYYTPPGQPLGVQLYGANSTPGISCSVHVNIPENTDFAEGVWAYAQVMPQISSIENINNQCKGRVGAQGVTYLDTEFPYLPEVATGVTTPELILFDDSPFKQLGLATDEAFVHHKFRLHILFKPADSDTPANAPGQWVSLQSVNWELKYCVGDDANGWYVNEDAVTKPGQWTENRNQPEWSSNWTLLMRKDVACPDPCPRP